MQDLSQTSSEPLLPAIEPRPEAFIGDLEALEEQDERDSIWNRTMPRGVPFFKVALLDQLLRRPYHAATVTGPFMVKELAQAYREKIFRSETHIGRSDNYYVERLLLDLGEGVFGYLDDDTIKVYAPTPQAAVAAAREFRRYLQPNEQAKPYFHVISMNVNGPGTEKVFIKRPAPVSADELALNYGSDFPAWETEWVARLRKSESGLTVLFGPPGCGKTSYLRALMSKLLDEAVFYFVPVSESEMLSNPRFVSFWVKETQDYRKKQKIAILEDAEDLLLTRDGGSRDRVSNLLNIADGFLGDHLKLHVIATTNVPFSKLDPAIIRPGRLIGLREFRRLSRPEASLLAKARGVELPEQSDYSLAELYCSRTETTCLDQRPIGFA